MENERSLQTRQEAVRRTMQTDEEGRLAKLRELGDCLRTRRIELGLSTRKTAKLAGISYAYLSILESGNNPKTHKPSRPSFEVLSRIDQILGLNGETYELADYPPTKLTGEQQSYIRKMRLEKGLQDRFTRMKNVFLTLDEIKRAEMLEGLAGLVDRYKTN